MPRTDTFAFADRGGIEVLTWPVFEEHAVDVVVTTRHGGCSTGPYRSLNLGLHVGDDDTRVLTNRARAAAAVGAALDDLVVGQQVHGRAVAVVGAGDRGRGSRGRSDAVPGVDALVTTEPGVALAVLVADCVPIVLFEPRARILACVHAGWRGTSGAGRRRRVGGGHRPGGAGGRGRRRRRPGRSRRGATRSATTCWRPPRPASAATWPTSSGVIPPARWCFDLWQANVRLLRAAGVPDAQVHLAALPTGGARFFSDRAQRPCGRFAAIARLRPSGGAERRAAGGRRYDRGP